MVGSNVLVAFVLVASPGASLAAETPTVCFVEEAKLAAIDPMSGANEFGSSVSLSNDTALVGAPDEDGNNGQLSGSAYVFVRNGTSWIQEARLTASDSQPFGFFGVSVSLSGDTALVGAHGDGVFFTGAAYVFVRSGRSWTEQAKLTASDAADHDHFGWAVSTSGDTALVGAYGNDDNGSVSGSAYVYVRSGTSWTEQAKLTASDGAQQDRFGISVSIFGDTALVGAYGSSSAYVFVRNGTSWTEEAKLTASDGEPHDFGWSVSLAGETALVGAPLDDDNGTDSGSAYVFVRNGTLWTEEAKLMASDGAAGDRLGISVSLAGDRALMGAHEDDEDDALGTGSAYVFRRSGIAWAEEAKLAAGDAAPHDAFGESVSIAGDRALMGAPGDDNPSPDSGSAYVFALPPPPSIYCTAGISASGCQASISSTGVPSATTPLGFSLIASSVEGAKDGTFFFGKGGQQANPWGNGTSFLCVVPPLTRAGRLAGRGTPGACDGAFAQDLNALWCPACPMPQKNPGVCTTVQAQLWYRDPLSTSNQTASLSDAIEFVVGL